MKPTKEGLRAMYKANRKQLSLDQLNEGSLKIAAQVGQICDSHPEWIHFHLFLPIERFHEVDTFLIKDLLTKRNKTLYTGLIDPESEEMKTVLLHANTSFTLDKYGIPIPEQPEIVSPDQIQVVFVPLLVVDSKGGRIGYGKGHYDRFLGKLEEKVVKIGLSFFEPIEQIPTESFDVPLDYCITPKNVFTFSNC